MKDRKQESVRLFCDACGDANCSVVSGFKKIQLCNKCMDDLYHVFKTHLMVRETMRISKLVETKIKEVE